MHVHVKMKKLNMAGQGRIEGSMNGISTSNPSQKVWLVGEAIGDISFSFTYSLILLEIQVGMASIYNNTKNIWPKQDDDSCTFFLL